MYWLDFTGACLSLTSTYYFTQAKRLAWLVGLVAIVLNALLYWEKALFGQMLLESLYFGSMIYGWFRWTRQSDEKQTPIRTLTLKEALFYIMLTIMSIAGLSQLLLHGTSSDVPYWDASITVLGLLAQWLLCLRVLHCWFVWLLVDAMIAILQCYKGIPFHSVLHWIYLGMALVGYWRWKQLHQDAAIQKCIPNADNYT